jgi:hypothetical protein
VLPTGNKKKEEQPKERREEFCSRSNPLRASLLSANGPQQRESKSYSAFNGSKGGFADAKIPHISIYAYIHTYIHTYIMR